MIKKSIDYIVIGINCGKLQFHCHDESWNRDWTERKHYYRSTLNFGRKAANRPAPRRTGWGLKLRKLNFSLTQNKISLIWWYHAILGGSRGRSITQRPPKKILWAYEKYCHCLSNDLATRLWTKALRDQHLRAQRMARNSFPTIKFVIKRFWIHALHPKNFNHRIKLILNHVENWLSSESFL